MEQVKMIPRIDLPVYSKLLEKYYCRATHLNCDGNVFTIVHIFRSYSEAESYYYLKLSQGYWSSV